MKTPPSPKYKMLRVGADKLQPHPEAQRELSPARIKKLTANFNLDAVGTIHVVDYPIDGKEAYWIIDGQHRWRSLMDLGLGEWEVDVKVHLGVKTDAEASALFLQLNDRLSVKPFDKFKNRLQAREDAAVAINDIVTKYGMRVASSTADGCIVGIAALEKTYRLDDGKALDKTLATSTGAWGRRTFDAKLIEGIGLVYARFDGTIEQPAMVKKLAKYKGGAPALIGDARGLMEYLKGSLARSIAECVIGIYNSGRRVGRLEPL